jgi:hypothetical protein
VTNSTISGNATGDTTSGAPFNGGGISNFYSLIVTGSTISGNSTGYGGTGGDGGGIYTSGDLVVTMGTVIVSSTTGTGGTGAPVGHRGYGGGIFALGGTAALQGSVLDSNAAGFGGGIWNASGDTFRSTGSTFSANTDDAGASGGGLYNEGTATIANATFSGNSAKYGGGIFNAPVAGISLTLRNITVASNTAGVAGGGLYQYNGTLDIGNSLLGGNTAASGADYIYLGGARTDAGHNFVGASLGQSWTAAGDIDGNTATVVAPLADNGGTTALPDGTHPKTHALLPGCAPGNRCPIDNGDSALCAASPVSNVDERGVARPQPPGRCDIGAFEAPPPPPPNPLPPPQPPGGGSGAPNPLPSARPPGAVVGAPNPLPPTRP